MHSPMWSLKEIVFAVTAMIVVLCGIIVLRKKGRITRGQAIATILLLMFTIFVFGSTVFGREPRELQYMLEPFWSYKEIRNGNMHILIEVILNVFLLMPAGFLLSFVIAQPNKYLFGLLFGIAISSTIEILQLVWRRGLFEFDDIFHNGLGCLVGYCIGNVILKGIRKLR